MSMLTASALARWRQRPIEFIETQLYDPETRRPFVLLPAEREFLKHAFRLDASGRLLYPEMVYSCPKKSGKTTFAALLILASVLLFGGAFAEAFALANDQEQARARVFEMIRRIIEASPLLRREAKITESRITFPAFNATITAVASDAASAAGANPTISCFDELWAYTSERSRRLWDEMVPPPTRKVACRLTVTYAGYSGESLLLEELYKRGKALPEVAPALHAGDGLLFFWSHVPVAPWQDARWLAEMRKTQRPAAYARMVLNEFAAAESAFIDVSQWDACTQASLTPCFDCVPVYVGVDASTKRDSTALVAVTYDKGSQCVRLVAHQVFTPTPGDPIDFEQTVERVLLDWRHRFLLRAVWTDPFQMAAVAQRLAKAGIKIEEYPQTVPNLTAATSNLFDLIQERRLVLYPDANMRLSAARAIIVESSRGWRLDKLKQSHKIDVIVALSMACLAAVQGAGKHVYTLEPFSAGFRDLDAPADADAPAQQPDPDGAAFYQARLHQYLRAFGGYGWP
jgi:phage terminase large subunit-like protein